MDISIQRALNDKLYDKRKVGALEYDYDFSTVFSLPSNFTLPRDIKKLDADLTNRLERIIRELAVNKDYDRIHKIIQQLCNDYAYAVHTPHSRNGGLIGLAAAAIALGPVLMSSVECVCLSLTFYRNWHAI